MNLGKMLLSFPKDEEYNKVSQKTKTLFKKDALIFNTLISLKNLFTKGTEISVPLAFFED